MRRLHTRIFFHFLAVLAAVGLVTMVVFATGWRSQFPRTITERLLTYGAAEVAEHFDEPQGRDRTIAKLADKLGVDITVRDPAGRVLATRGGQLPPLGEAERADAGHGVIFLHHGANWFVAGPIVDSNTSELRGLFEATPVKRFHPPSPLRPLLAAALALLLAGLLSVPLARRISRPVELLTDATRRFGDGDLSARVPVGPPRPQPGPLGRLDCPPPRRFGHRHRRVDELDELSRAWNDMADRVERLVRGHKELLANVSHELRSPLARMRMALELLPRRPEDELRVRDIEGDLADLDRLIEDVLTASRLEATGLPAHLGPVEIAPLLAGLAERARLDPVVAGHEVRVECEGAPVIVADGALLRRALWNLVENAAKYGAPPLTLSARAAAGGLELAVSDEGRGIAPADRQRVLDPFERIDRARTPSAAGQPHRGFGLGLTIARRVAEVHGGSIRIEPARVESGAEVGCRITLSLPA